VGCGENIKIGFDNMDFYSFGIRRTSRPVIGHDFRYPLPFGDMSFEGAYSEHCLEHLAPDHAIQLMHELRRVLKPGAVFRCSVPDLERYVGYYGGQEINPEFKKFRSGCEAIWSLTQNWGHLSVWDAPMLIRQLEGAGFASAARQSFRQGRNSELLIDRDDRQWESVYVEAIR
jgi:SAM-dependent methyltransferase